MVIIGGGVSGSACGIRCVNEGLSPLLWTSPLEAQATSAGVPHDAVICVICQFFFAIEQQLLASGDTTRDDYTTMIWFCSLSAGEKCGEQPLTPLKVDKLSMTLPLAAVLFDAGDEKNHHYTRYSRLNRRFDCSILPKRGLTHG